ncbi:3-phosphoserine/phosphohydroxythreonine transaminase [bacterium]|nr:3-phosphoserine/phosphohydroxythreonine transaminase [bacterium]
MSYQYNFSAGPAMIPKEVMLQAQHEFLNFNETGISIMEMSHRSKEYLPIVEKAEKNFRNLLNIPNNYKVLFLQGGAITQNFMVPMNLLSNRSASYVVSGYWSKRTYNDAQPFGTIKLAASSEPNNFKKVPSFESWNFDNNDAYVHFCQNETVHGAEYFDTFKIPEVPLVCDMSSTILSRPINIDDYGVIYAGAQKNIGPSGLTIVIVRDDLLSFADQKTPSTLNWKIQAENNSMINTPTTFSIYMAGLVFEWLLDLGGLKKIEELNIKKSNYLYNFIDADDFYINDIEIKNRSRMNIPFRMVDDDLTKKFVATAEEKGLYALKGHRVVGGLRASLYNAMPFDGVECLVEFMKDFKKNNT